MNAGMSGRPSAQGRWRLVITTAAIASITLAGYLVFRAFAGGWSASNLPVLALVAGVASFFSPCAFPLLPGYFGLYHEADVSGSKREGGRTLVLGMAAALGVISFALVLGLLITLLGTAFGQAFSISGAEPSRIVLGFRALVGISLIGLGIAQLAGLSLKPAAADALAFYTRPRPHGGQSARAFYLYGFGYTAAGLGCTGPILAGLMLSALGTRGAGGAMAAFAIYATAMGGLMLLVSALVAASRQTLITRMRAAGPAIKRFSAILLILTGAFTLASSLALDSFVRLLFP